MALENAIRAALLASAVALSGCKTIYDGPIQPTGLRPAYPPEANCPKIIAGSGYFASTFNSDSSLRQIKHTGIDIEAPIGTPVRAVADGVVEGISVYPRLGHEVRIKHYALKEDGLMDLDNPYPLGAQFYSHSAHLGANIPVNPKQKVRKGDVIGFVGPHSQGAHLHFDIGIEKYFDPLRAFSGSVLNDPRDSSVKIPYIDQNESLHPKDTRVIWPIACTKK